MTRTTARVAADRSSTRWYPATANNFDFCSYATALAGCLCVRSPLGSIRGNAAGLVDATDSTGACFAPASIHARTSAMSEAGSFGAFLGGGINGFFVCSIDTTSALSDAFPGTIAGPSSPPFISDA
jgi:hypothetical protein